MIILKYEMEEESLAWLCDAKNFKYGYTKIITSLNSEIYCVSIRIVTILEFL